MYKLNKSELSGNIIGVVLLPSTYIPFAPDNTDYVNFKSQINAEEAQLEDADGVLMSPEEAKAFVKELP